MKRSHLFGILVIGSVVFFSSCQKDSVSPSSVYVPAASDATATATLSDLQQGYSLYTSRCNACHSLYSPDSFSASNWKTIVPGMASRAGLTSSESALVLKYVTRGNS